MELPVYLPMSINIEKNYKKMANKKAISPIVATALLLVVAVVAVFGFSTWFNTYQSTVQVKVEGQATASVTIDRLENDGRVYLRNGETTNVNITEVKITQGSDTCTNDTEVEFGQTVFQYTTLDGASACNLTEDESADVVAISPSGVFSATLIVR